jgi:DNA 3'-phosphatase
MWRNVDTVMYYKHKDFKFLQTIAIFSFIGTIVKRVVPDNDIEAVKKLDYLYDMDTIREKLRSITDKGASIILYDSFRTEYIDDIKKSIEQFQVDMGCPIASFISTKSNKYSKPFTGMVKIMELFYKKHKTHINKPMSMVIGNKAGRISINRRKVDKSCSDRAFAYNTGMKFTTPDRFFLGKNLFSLWEWNPQILDRLNREVWVSNTNAITPPIVLDELNKLPASNIYTLIITGTPSCGKTTFSKKIKRKWDADYDKGVIEMISDNTNTIEKIESRVGEVLSGDQSIIVDISCTSVYITRIVKKSMEHRTPILIIEIKTNSKISQLLDFMKVQTATSPDVVTQNKITWRNYYKQYIRPSYKNVPCVHHVEFPLVIQISEEFWFEYSH